MLCSWLQWLSSTGSHPLPVAETLLLRHSFHLQHLPVATPERFLAQKLVDLSYSTILPFPSSSLLSQPL